MPKNSSTEQFVEIADIRDNVVILKNGSLRAIIEVAAINFELRSEEEQIAILQNFQRFINSVDFPIQIASISRKLNIDDYLKVIAQSVEATDNELIKIQGLEYSNFIKELSELANIMQKKFFVIVPFYPTNITAPSAKGLLEGVREILGPSKTTAVRLDEEKFQTAQNQLLQKVELIYGGLVGLGIKSQLLQKEELMSLFYGIYNHDTKTVFHKENTIT